MHRIFHYRLIALLFVFSAMGIKVMAMSSTISERPLVDVLKDIQIQYEVILSYNTKDVKNINIDFVPKAKEELTVAMERALENTGLKYKYLGLNFYTIYKDNSLNKRKISKIERKIRQIKRLGKEDNLVISNHKTGKVTLPAVSTKSIDGIVTDANGTPLVGASIMVTGTTRGTTSDGNGAYQIDVPLTSSQLEVSYTGYHSQKVEIGENQRLNIQLEEGLLLQAVTVVGSRGTPRTNFDSPVPVDHISSHRLTSSGRPTLDEQLAQVVPSFHSAQHPVSDASAHFNPIGLKGLLPSRTLVLINGKRKNASALLYSYVTASRGEVGVDLKSIMPDAIESVEVLRDGAAAQYGSDAIAGVLNIVMKDKIAPFVNTSYSLTHAGDGAQYQASGGFSFDVFKKGFATFMMSYHQQHRSQRAGTISSAADEAQHWGGSGFSLSDFEAFLSRNPKAGFEVGLPDIQAVNLSLNAGYTINEASNTELYAFGTIMQRGGRSPQFARGPYWVPGFEAIYPNQDFFLPEMAPQIGDHTVSLGLLHTIGGWNMDLSASFGSSQIDYFIHNSFNQSLGADSPKDFFNGTHAFNHFVNNVDFIKTFHPKGIQSLTVALGAEQRIETFVTEAGEFASYGDGSPDIVDRIGSESFSGLHPKDEVRGTRNNIGFYTELTVDITERLQTGAATRFENYSDFGGNLSWMWNARYQVIPNKLNVRGSMSSGFRAPSLHQIYYASTTTTLTPTGIVQNRILNNLDPALNILRVPELRPETSFNLGGGFNYKFSKKVGFSVDVYRIDVDDRIVLSGQIGRQAHQSSPINQLLENTDTGSAGFFLNAVNTTTQGIDLVFNLDHVRLGKGIVQSTLAANFSSTNVTAVHLPDFIEGNDLMDEVFSREDVSRLETWRPREKVVLTTTYTQGVFSTAIGFNYYGSVSYKHPVNPADDASYGGKAITDVSMTYAFSDRIKWQLGVQNLFNVYPDTFTEAYDGVPEDRNIDFVGRFQYPWQTMQIGIDGLRGFTKLNFNF